MDQNQLSLPLLAKLEQDYRHCLVSAGWSEAKDAKDAGMLPKCLVALSGGADSVLLFVALSGIYSRAKQPERLIVCHVNHNVRQTASRDAAFCANLAKSLGHRYEERQLSGLSHDEATMRAERYQALSALCQQLSIPYVVTAHHLDDQIETFVFRLLRGMSAAGAVGIKPVLSQGAVTVLRPLLQWRHDSIVDCLKTAGIGYVEDESNSDTRYARNFLRAEILPQLTSRFPQSVPNIEHFRGLVELDQSYIAEQVDELSKTLIDKSGSLDLTGYRLLHPALQGRMLVEWLRLMDVSADYRLIERLQRMIEQKLGAQSVKNNLQAIVQGGRLLLQSTEIGAEETVENLLDLARPVSITVPQHGRRTVVLPWLGCALILTRLEGEQVCEAQRNIFSQDLQLGALIQFEFRLRQAGDLFAASGPDGHLSRLKKYLHRRGGAKAPELDDIARLYQGGAVGRLNRNQLLRHLPLFAAGNEVLWLPGLGISQRVKVREQADTRLELISLNQHPDIDGALPGVTC